MCSVCALPACTPQPLSQERALGDLQSKLPETCPEERKGRSPPGKVPYTDAALKYRGAGEQLLPRSSQRLRVQLIIFSLFFSFWAGGESQWKFSQVFKTADSPLSLLKPRQG